MPRTPTTKPERWEYQSLDWIHRVREHLFETEQGVPLTELEPTLSRDAARLAAKLKRVPAGQRLRAHQ